MKKSTIVVIALAVICGGFSLWSISAAPANTDAKIDEIGTVEFTVQSKGKIDAAVNAYNALDDKFNEKDAVTRKNTLDKAKAEYCRLAIEAAIVADARQIPDEYTTTEVAKFVSDARAVVDAYLTADEKTDLDDYSTLLELEAEYTANSGSGSSETVDIPMC